MPAKDSIPTDRTRSSSIFPAARLKTPPTARPSSTGGSPATWNSSRSAPATPLAMLAVPSTSSLSRSNPDSAPGGLRRVLGFGFGLAVIVGATLGIGILRTPGLVAGQISSPAAILAVWIVGGLYTLVSAACFSELGTMLPEEGGYYVYARHAFGNTVGFAVGWTDWLTYCSVLGYVSIGMAEFTGVLIPPLAGSVSTVAVSILVGLVALQWAGVRVSSGFQQATTAIKFAAFLVVVIAAFTIGHRVPQSTTVASNASLTGLVVALQA